MDEVDLIKQKIDIVDFIGNIITLKRAGRNFKAVCPFHNEKSPSFVVSPERQIWHCFGCSRGGDIFTFVQEYERLTFSESLKLLADKTGVKLKKSYEGTKKDEKKQRIYEINHLTSQFYHFLLTKHKSGKEALLYVLEKRKLNNPLLETYLLGYAPKQPDSLTKYLVKKKGYTTEELIEAGVSTIRYGKTSDFFQNRIIFPIMDSNGNILAFSGRGLNDKAIPKYINTKETSVYIKGDTLFGIYQAKEEIKKEGKVLLMEGEFDVITSFKEGITNAVAVKGTALTENQIRLLKRFAQKIIFCFDTDNAGVEAQRRSISLITKLEINASVVIPPQGKDADEILNENPIAFKKALKNEVNIYDFIIDSAIKLEKDKGVDGKKNILKSTLPYLSELTNEVIKEHYLKKLAEALDSSYESVVRESEKIKTPQPKITEPKQKTIIKPRQEMLEEHLLTLIVQAKNPKEAFITSLSIIDSINLMTPVFQQIYETFKKYFTTSETLNVVEINKLLEDAQIKTFDMLFLNPLPEFQNDEAYLNDLQKTSLLVYQTAVKKHLENLSFEIKKEEKEGSERRLLELQEEFNKIASSLK